MSSNSKKLQHAQLPVSETDKQLRGADSVGKRLKGCIPDNPSSFLLAIFMIVYLLCVITRTGDMTKLDVLLFYMTGRAGKPFWPYEKKGEENS